jgi:phosphoribosylamine--glycine ligase
MKILIIGSGGREHALAWKLTESDRVEQVVVAPGNGGTASSGHRISNFDAANAGLLEFALEAQIDLTLVGPEIPLANGIVDDFQAGGLRIWGPTRAAARIETDKAFAKAFMERHNIPTGAYAAFNDHELALRYLLQQSQPVVVKATGLAAGKGVIVPDTIQEAETALRRIMVDREFGSAGDEVIIEERLSGPEVSVLAFCDGHTLIPMPPAQDHKRAFDNDAGPNTGGMGAYAPAPICPPDLLDQVTKTVLQPSLDGLRREGHPFVGILYAGLMLTQKGPMVLEFNCRFGDPETQVILPLLETSLVEIVERSLDASLSQIDVAWKTGSAATVVLASAGYPGGYETGKPITGLEQAAGLEGVTVFHAGTKLEKTGQIVTSGGRVLNVTGVGPTLTQALERAYAGVDRIEFEGKQFRTDIGAREIERN